MRTACPGNLRATALVVILANRHPLLNCQECHWLLWPLQVLSCSSSLAVSSRTLEWLCLTVSQVAKWKCSLCRENKVGLELGGNLLIPENVVSAFFKPTKNNFDILENKGKKMDSFAFLYTKWGIWVQSYLIWSYFEHEKKSLIFKKFHLWAIILYYYLVKWWNGLFHHSVLPPKWGPDSAWVQREFYLFKFNTVY